MATVYIANPSSHTFDLIVGGLPVHIPAHRFAPNPVMVKVRDDLADALMATVRKRPVLRIVIPDAPVEEVAVYEPVPMDRGAFVSSCKAAKANDGLWDLTLPDGTHMTVEAGHHTQAKELAYEMIYGAGPTAEEE